MGRIKTLLASRFCFIKNRQAQVNNFSALGWKLCWFPTVVIHLRSIHGSLSWFNTVLFCKKKFYWAKKNKPNKNSITFQYLIWIIRCSLNSSNSELKYKWHEEAAAPSTVRHTLPRTWDRLLWLPHLGTSLCRHVISPRHPLRCHHVQARQGKRGKTWSHLAQRGEVREQDGGSVQTAATLEKILKKIKIN